MAVALVAVIDWFDYITGDFSMAVFYPVPGVLTTWFAGRPSGWFIWLLSATASRVGNLAPKHFYGHPLMPYWNAAMPVLIYGIVVQLLSLARHRTSPRNDAAGLRRSEN